jgi:hypothetical protein
VRVHLAGLDRHLARIESIPRLIAAAIVLTAIVIGSALAAAIDTGTSDFRSTLSDVALSSYVASTAVAILLVVALLWRLVRPEGRRSVAAARERPALAMH